jgi:hypothetical protein
MKKLIIPVMAIAMAFGTSAFTAKITTSSFYKYNGTTFTQANIQNINNYTADTSAGDCTDVQNVCGVELSTAKTVGQTPVPAEFSSESSALWASQQAHSPSDDAVLMKP